VLQISPELRAYLGAPGDRGVLVDGVRADSPAAKAGIHVGDVIVGLDNHGTGSASDLLGAMSTRKKGDTVSISAIRDHNPVQLRATLDEDPGPQWSGRSFRFGTPGAHMQMPDLEHWFEQMPNMGSSEIQKQLDAARARIDELERRLDKLDHD